MSHNSCVGAATAAACVATLIYINSLPAGFAFDDTFAVVNNQDVLGTTSLGTLLRHDFWGQDIASNQSHKSYRPLTVLLFRSLHYAWQALPLTWRTQLSDWREHSAPVSLDAPDLKLPPTLDPLIFHATNVALNAWVSALVCILAHRLFVLRFDIWHARTIQRAPSTARQRCSSKADTAGTAGTAGAAGTEGTALKSGSWSESDHRVQAEANVEVRCSGRWQTEELWQVHVPVWVTGLCFAVHPVHTEAVSGVVGQAELLCAALSIPALLLYLRAADSDHTAPGRGVAHWARVGGALALTWAATLAKEVGITIIGAMVAYDLLLVSLAQITASAPASLDCKQEDSKTSTATAGVAGASTAAGNVSNAAVAAAATVAATAAGAKNLTTSSPGRKRQLQGAACVTETARAQDGSSDQVSRTHASTSRGSSSNQVGSASRGCSSACDVECFGVKLRAMVAQRKWVRLAAATSVVALYVGFRGWIAGDHLVRIFRMVENPIPFSNFTTRSLSIGHLHVRYVHLLLWPRHLSADWSYSCVPLVEDWKDPRNLCTVLLYIYLMTSVIAAQPWKVLTAWVDVKTGWQPSLALWRMFVLMTLVVGPFFPASNVLFYVGTFIGERLLYFPSLGFSLLASEAVVACGVAGCMRAARNSHSSLVRLAGRTGRAILLAGVAALLVGGAARTWTRNWDWISEEALFGAALKVCPESAKVRLNSGILARRHGNHVDALQHMLEAQRIEPGYCEPTYWIGIIHLGQGDLQSGVTELEQSLSCKYVAREALQALNKVYAALRTAHTPDPLPLARWGAVLARPEVGRVAEACDVLESAALAMVQTRDVGSAIHALDVCEKALQTEGIPDQHLGDHVTAEVRLQLLLCHTNRRAILMAMGQYGQGPYAKQALYTYMTAVQTLGPHCRMGHSQIVENLRTPAAEGQAAPSLSDGQPSVHMQLVHMFQAQDADDPWLQREWGECITLYGRTVEAATHFAVSGLLLRATVAAGGGAAGQDKRLMTPVNGKLLDTVGVAVEAAGALQRAAELAVLAGAVTPTAGLVPCELQALAVQLLTMAFEAGPGNALADVDGLKVALRQLATLTDAAAALVGGDHVVVVRCSQALQGIIGAGGE